MAKKTNNENSQWNSQPENRFVAFFDILGFKDSVLKEEHDVIYEKLYKLSNHINVLEKPFTGENGEIVASNLKTYNFSDSIIIFSKTDSKEDFNTFYLSAIVLFSKAINMGIPLKGGIAHGKITINQSKKIFFGQPLIDAYQIEEDLKYFGIAVHNSIEKYMEKIEVDNKINHFFFEETTPFKSGKIIHKNLNWFLAYAIEKEIEITERNKVKEVILKKIKEFRLTTSGSPRIYIDNTLNIIESLYK